LLPAYFADYWGREKEFEPFRNPASVTYISSLDANLAPDAIDDREALPSLTVPTLVIVGHYDLICGERWARELNDLLPHSQLAVLEDSAHMGHVEEPEEFTAVTTFTGWVSPGGAPNGAIGVS
jgi:proline iminopeptidase